MNILFDYHIYLLPDSLNNTKLPFTVFGMSQQGLSHVGYSIGNQDAGCVYVGKNLIVGAVADGCTSGQNLNGMSSNQVGAHIISYLAVRNARKLVDKKRIPMCDFLEAFQETLFGNLRRTLNSLNPWISERQSVLSNFFGATILIFVITPQHYKVLSCGDGDVYINGQKKPLLSSANEYFANNLYDIHQGRTSKHKSELKYKIKCIHEGTTDYLSNLLIATDGFMDQDVEDVVSFRNFFFPIQGPKVKRGFIDRKVDFRNAVLEKIVNNKKGKLWPIDDATFISLQRVSNLDYHEKEF